MLDLLIVGLSSSLITRSKTGRHARPIVTLLFHNNHFQRHYLIANDCHGALMSSTMFTQAGRVTIARMHIPVQLQQSIAAEQPVFPGAPVFLQPWFSSLFLFPHLGLPLLPHLQDSTRTCGKDEARFAWIVVKIMRFGECKISPTIHHPNFQLCMGVRQNQKFRFHSPMSQVGETALGGWMKLAWFLSRERPWAKTEVPLLLVDFSSLPNCRPGPTAEAGSKSTGFYTQRL